MAEIIDIGAVGDYSQLAGYGVMDAAGTSVPADGTLGYGHGCIFRKANGTTGADAIYVNIGTKASANFDILNPSYVPSVALRSYPVRFTDLRVWDAMQTILPGTAAADDLGISTGSIFPWSTGYMSLKSVDFGGTSTTAYARFLFPVPPNYVAASAVSIVLNGAVQSLADTSATIDVEAVRVGDAATDICATAAQSINSNTSADYTFSMTADNIVAGDILDTRIKFAGSDVGDLVASINLILYTITYRFTTLQ